MQAGYSVEQIHDLTHIDRWFLYKLQGIIETGRKLEALSLPVGREQQVKNPEQQAKNWGEAEIELLYEAKRKGFSDFQIARALWKDAMTQEHPLTVRRLRKSFGITPVVKQIDTLAGNTRPEQITCT